LNVVTSCGHCDCVGAGVDGVAGKPKHTLGRLATELFLHLTETSSLRSGLLQVPEQSFVLRTGVRAPKLGMIFIAQDSDTFSLKIVFSDNAFTYLSSKVARQHCHVFLNEHYTGIRTKIACSSGLCDNHCATPPGQTG
jgi:hypothetical protein